MRLIATKWAQRLVEALLVGGLAASFPVFVSRAHLRTGWIWKYLADVADLPGAHRAQAGVSGWNVSD